MIWKIFPKLNSSASEKKRTTFFSTSIYLYFFATNRYPDATNSNLNILLFSETIGESKSRLLLNNLVVFCSFLCVYFPRFTAQVGYSFFVEKKMRFHLLGHVPLSATDILVRRYYSVNGWSKNFAFIPLLLSSNVVWILLYRLLFTKSIALEFFRFPSFFLFVLFSFCSSFLFLHEGFQIKFCNILLHAVIYSVTFSI